MKARPPARSRDLTVVLRGARTAWSADRSGTAVAMALQLLGALSALGVVLAGKLALEAITGGEARVDSRLVGSLALLALATAATGVASSLQRYQQRLLGERVSQRLWGTVLRTIARTDLITWESPAFVDRLERVSSNALSRPTSVVTSLLALVGSLFGVVGMTAALLLIHPVLVPALLLAGVPSVWFSRRAGAAEFAFARASNGSARRRLYYKQILLQRQNAAEVRAFGSAGWLVARHEQEDAEYLGLLRTHVRRRQVVALLSTCVAALALAATLVIIVVLVSRGSITLAEAGAAAIAARLLGGQLSTTFSALGSLIESAPFLADMESFLETSSRDEPAGRPRALQHDLELRDVSFSYGGGHGLALDRVSIRVPRGSVVAVVGENGSGKTTLAKIVSGLYDPTSGIRSWDGDPDVPAADVRASTTVLLQDFIRYQLTFADNVSVAQTVEPADRSRIGDALEQVGLTDAVQALPGGLDTLLGKQFGEGTDLSGGQWQRLALARALYRDAPLVVLDEPTSALDPRAEHDLFADVRRVLDGRSALLISHRYSSVRLADHIYVMEDGQVLEEGSHDDLMTLGGRYAELYTLQSAVYLR